MATESEPKVPPYQPHNEYVAGRTLHFHKPIPPLPPHVVVSTQRTLTQTTDNIQPLPPAYNGRPHYIHDTTRLTIPQIQPYMNEPSPTFSTNSGKSSRLAVQSWLPIPQEDYVPYSSGTFRSHFSQSSLIADIPFVLRFRIFVMRWIIEWWLLEIISWTFSALCMITIIAILFAYDGNELPRWPLGLTLNGLVSVLSASAKSALLLPTAEALGQLKWNWFSKGSRSLIDFEVLDAASRGPWGSALLLMKAMREKGLNLASIGAIVVILCLPLDLFFQQIISYEQAFIVMPMNASVPRTTTFESVGAFMQNGVEMISADESMSSVVLPFFYSNGTLPTLQSYCPTSNCTWEPFETLGVCSACEPIPEDYLVFDCHTGPADWLTNNKNYTGGPSAFPNVTQCGWFLNSSDPETRLLMNGYVMDNDTAQRGEQLNTRIFNLVDVFSFAPYWGGSVSFKDRFPSSILDAFIVGSPGGVDDIGPDRRPTASECALTWCTQTLQASASWGNITESIANEHFRDTQNLPYPFWVNDDVSDIRWTNNISITPSEQHAVTLEDHSTTAEPKSFGLNNLTALQTAFIGQIVAPSFLTTDGEELTFKDMLWRPEGTPTRGVRQNPWFGDVDIPTRFERIAQAMTTVMRNEPAPGAPRELILGTSWDERTHVQIRWAWIILPLFLLLLSLLLLIGTVMKSTREESVVGIWKTSVIAILFNGIDESVQRSVGPNCRMTEARAKAREFKVKLVPE